MTNPDDSAAIATSTTADLPAFFERFDPGSGCAVIKLRTAKGSLLVFVTAIGFDCRNFPRLAEELNMRGSSR